MEFHKYQHIVKLGFDEADGILNGTVSLFYKIDGTNSQVFLKDDGTLGFGSRTREITPEDDNADFALSMTQNKELYNGLLVVLKEHPNYTIYGEWLVPHTLKSYVHDAWKKFYVFDILDEDTGAYLPYPQYVKLLENCPQCRIIPIMCEMENPTEDQIKAELQQTGAFLCAAGLGEGIVIKNYNFINKYGRRTWAKMLTEDFLDKKKNLRSFNKGVKDGTIQNATEHAIIDKYLTDEHIAKEYSKVCEKYGEAIMDRKHTFELLNRVFFEFWSDNWEIILNKMHLPTVNFKALKTICDTRVKEVVATINHP